MATWAELAVAAAMAAGAAPVSAQRSTDAADIRRVVTSAYVDGIHKNGSREAIRAGFHPSFVMKVLGKDGVSDVTIEQWIGRLPPEGKAPDHKVTHRIPNVSISGAAAVAMVEILFDDKHIFTDYMSLYRFDNGWRIVAKIFNREG
jgi:hypothetical protein